MNTVSTPYLQANIGETVLMLIRGKEVLLTRNEKRAREDSDLTKKYNLK